MTGKPEPVSVQVIYAGQREVNGGKLAHSWIVDGEEKLFAKPTGGVIGGIYLIKMTPDHESVYKYPAVYTLERSDDVRTASWEIEHKRVARKRKREAAERKHKADGELTNAYEPLDRITEKLRSPEEARVLGVLVAEHILDHYWKTRK